nr:MAG TPA: hypothetical protein [Caudoviricetes sp.]
MPKCWADPDWCRGCLVAALFLFPACHLRIGV